MFLFQLLLVLVVNARFHYAMPSTEVQVARSSLPCELAIPILVDVPLGSGPVQVEDLEGNLVFEKDHFPHLVPLSKAIAMMSSGDQLLELSVQV